MKKVLVVHYSQSGQLTEIMENVTSTFGEGVLIDDYRIRMEEEFPFPWTKKEFYGAFPETYLQVPHALAGMDDPKLLDRYDLVVIAYQVWFLTPSVPINSFLKDPLAKTLLKDTPVVTLVACRNMWIQAQEKMKGLLKANDARLVGHIALVDRHIMHISVITIAHWMFGGKKTRKFGFFPKPGVSEADISASVRFGEPIGEAVSTGEFSSLQDRLLALDAVKVNPYLVRTDKRGNVIFSKWARAISSKGEKGSDARRPLTRAFEVYLFLAIWLIAPIVFVVHLLTYIFRSATIRADKRYYSSVETNAEQ